MTSIKEKIDKVAVMLTNGDILTGKNHAQILREAKGMAKFGKQGFITTFGRFVGRFEGLKIAKEAKQIIKKHGNKSILFSEDLKNDSYI